MPDATPGRRSLPRAATAALLVTACGLLVAACGATPTSTAAPSGSNPAAVTPTPPPSAPGTSAPSGGQTPGAISSATPFPFAMLDGMTCAGTWTDTMSGSSGPLSVTFDLQRDAAVILDVGGPVFGASGGHLVLPVTFSGPTFHIEGVFGFLGALTVAVGADGTASAVLDQPPALGSGSRVAVTRFSLADGALAIESTTTLGTTTVASTSVSAACTTAV